MKTQQSVLIVAVIGSLVLLNLIGLRVFGRADITKNGVYTLAQATKETMAALEEPVTVTAYFSENLPAPYSSNASYVRDLLEEYRSASKGKLAFEFIDPASQETDADKESKKELKRDIFGRSVREMTSVEKELQTDGIQPVEIRVVEADQQQTKRAFMGLVIKHQEKKEVIPVVQQVQGLEYDLTTLIRKLTRQKTPVVGVLQGHEGPKLEEKLRFLSTALSQMYEVRPVEVSAGKDRIEGDFDAIFVIGPKTALAPNEVKAIDQFLMAGKAVGFFLDAVHVDMRTLETTEATHGLGAMLASYGVTVSDQVVGDVSSASVNVNERRGFMMVQMPVPYPFIPVVKRMEGESAVSKGLGEVMFPFSTKVEAKGGEGVEAVVLARSSAKSWLEPKPPNLDARRDWRSETPTFNGPHALMVQVSGKLKSHFAAEATQSSAPGAAPVLGEAKSDARLVVVGGSALVQDDFMNSRGNQALLMNIADWMLLDPALLAMRSRGLQAASFKADLPDSTRNAVKYGLPLGMLVLLCGFGLVRWRMREAQRPMVTA